MLDVLSVAGARPNFIKVAALHHAFSTHPKIRSRIVHTGQHYDEKMSGIFFEQMGLPEPDAYLGIGGGTHAEQTARIMMAFEKVVVESRPDVVLVVGDVNSTVACALVSSKLHIPIVHVEAGLRSGDRSMPEEINRIVTDSLSDVLFVSEPSGFGHLKNEGIPTEKITFVGNVMIDSLERFRSSAENSDVRQQLGLNGEEYILVTLHRPATVDSEEGLRSVASIFQSIGNRRILFPIHPRTRKNIERFGLESKFNSIQRLSLIDPVGYLEFLNLIGSSFCVLTDSGGIQEETTHLNVPCLTLRPNTERPVTITHGTNELVAPDSVSVVANMERIENGTWKETQPIDGWDGKAAERIAIDLERRFMA